MPISESMEGAS
uniref:Uncharacterized protein n=1 Tax=Arundo donax TaxID=35708 RepID=A0A0A8ZS16_ARUDO